MTSMEQVILANFYKLMQTWRCLNKKPKNHDWRGDKMVKIHLDRHDGKQ